MPDERFIALIIQRGKSGLYKDTVPGNSWQGRP